LEKINKKGILKFILKVSISALAIYVVIQKIDLQQTKDILLHVHAGWIILALMAFNVSKGIASVRLNRFFKSIGLNLPGLYNLKLYYIGMFYNLFLPGGIGGDGYKVYLLNRSHKTSLKDLISATLLDRVSGLAALVFLAIFLALFVDLSFIGPWVTWILVAILIIYYPSYFIVFRILFGKFLAAYTISSVLSLAVQLAQLLCAYLILKALMVDSMYIEYMTLFLLSSVVAVIPFTIGGVGARELVFIFGADYLMIDKNTAVAFSILFFIVTAVSSFSGIFFETKLKSDIQDSYQG
jgi:uncharacterized membrane protein YbhN (UPF0104 family)